MPFVTAVGFLVALAESGELEADIGLELLAKLERFGRYHVRILDDAARRIREATKSGEQR